MKKAFAFLAFAAALLTACHESAAPFIDGLVTDALVQAIPEPHLHDSNGLPS